MCASRRYEDYAAKNRWPLSRLFHLNSSLGIHSGRQYSEQIAQFGEDPQRVRDSVAAKKEYPHARKIALPRPSLWGGKKLRSLLKTRRTRRGTFTDKNISIQELGAFLHYSSGISGEVAHPEFTGVVQKLRTWPSGGAMYPLEIYWGELRGATIEKGWYHYAPHLHALEAIAPIQPLESLQRLFFADGLWQNAIAIIVISAIWQRTQEKYGERGYRIILLDAGHLGQNMLLVSEDIGIQSISLGGFDDAGVAGVIGFDTAEEGVIHAILVGR